MMFLTDGEPSDDKPVIMEKLRELVEEVPDIISMFYGLDIANEFLEDLASYEFSKHGVSNPTVTPFPGAFEELNPHNIRVKLGRFYREIVLKCRF